MENHIIDAVLTLLGVGATGFIGYVCRAIVKFVVSKHIAGLAKEAVRFAEDAYKKYQGDTKLKHACQWLSDELAHYHIKVSENRIEGAVRAAYNEIVVDINKDYEKAQ